jgi:hypothetical protein
MKDIELTSAHDMKVDDDFHIIEGRLEVLQSTKITLLFIQTEWVFDFTLGIPWFTDMFDIEIPNIEKRKNIVKDLQNVINLRRLTAFEYNVDSVNRGALVSFQAETEFGPISNEVSI